MPHESIQILYIIVNYRSAELCADLTRRLLALPASESLHVMIVDNSEHASDAKLLSSISPKANLSIVTPPRNLGYFGGAAFGFNLYKAARSQPIWTIVSNPDIRFPDESFLKNLLALEIASDVGVVAPDIRLARDGEKWSDGVAQNPFMARRPSQFRIRALEAAFRLPLVYTLMIIRHNFRLNRSKGKASKVALPLRRTIYAPHGAVVVFARAFFERGGNLDYGAFLYGEEIFVGEELRLRELHCTFEPTLQLWHVGGATTSILGAGGQRRTSREAMTFLRKRYFA
jgi:GT2 family glycosyltransferase